MKTPAIGYALFVLATFAFAQENPSPTTQQAAAFERTITKTVGAKYLIYLPDGYGKDSAQKWPLMIFLHGSGERGENLELVKVHGPPKLIEQGKIFPFIVVSPQCPADQWWSLDMLDALFDEVLQHHAVDPDRIYLTGISMGGFAAWNWAAQRPETFAAVAPICGGANPGWAKRLKDVPIWAFHGAKDEIVNISESQNIVDRLRQLGGNVKFTIYPDAAHDSWTRTYANPELYEWFLSHRRPGG